MIRIVVLGSLLVGGLAEHCRFSRAAAGNKHKSYTADPARVKSSVPTVYNELKKK